MDNPIFTKLVREFTLAGIPIPWYTTVRPNGTITPLTSTTQGIQPYFNLTYIRGFNTGGRNDTI